LANSRLCFEDSHAASTGPRLRVARPNHDFNIDLKAIEDGNEPVHGITGVAAIHELGHIGLADAEPGAGPELRESKLLNAVCYPPGKRGLQLKLFRVREAKVGKNIPAVPGYGMPSAGVGVAFFFLWSFFISGFPVYAGYGKSTIKRKEVNAWAAWYLPVPLPEVKIGVPSKRRTAVRYPQTPNNSAFRLIGGRKCRVNQRITGRSH
jgi:hypothetical protein